MLIHARKQEVLPERRWLDLGQVQLSSQVLIMGRREAQNRFVRTAVHTEVGLLVTGQAVRTDGHPVHDRFVDQPAVPLAPLRIDVPTNLAGEHTGQLHHTRRRPVDERRVSHKPRHAATVPSGRRLRRAPEPAWITASRPADDSLTGMANPVTECPSCATKNRVPLTAQGHPRCGKCKADLPWLVDARDDTFESAVDTGVLVLVDLWAPWCGPCRLVAPVVEQLSRELAGQLKVVKVNVDESPATAQRYRAQSIPMLLVMDRGQVVDTMIGAQPAPLLRSRVAGALTGRA